jgi:hypothetical protein
MAKKRKTVSQLHKILWERYFSPYIRQRDALALHKEKGTDPDYAMCCSCGWVQHWKKMDAGHYISRGYKSILYDERNVNAQCKRCNGFKQGNASDYRKFLINKYSEEVVEELEALKFKIRQYRPPELEEMIETYKEKLKQLKE